MNKLLGWLLAIALIGYASSANGQEGCLPSFMVKGALSSTGKYTNFRMLQPPATKQALDLFNGLRGLDENWDEVALADIEGGGGIILLGHGGSLCRLLLIQPQYWQAAIRMIEGQAS